jgi:hypothetical protein
MAFANFVFKTRLEGKKRLATFVKRNTQDLAGLIKGLLYLVAVMGIYVNEKNALS